ncbi:MAG: hypothetical protein WD448_13550 [Woeseia sp.]
MDPTEIDNLKDLIDSGAPPRISLYQPTHRHFPQNQQDSIRFRNLLEEVEKSLSHEYESGEIGSLLEPLKEVARNEEFWNCTLDGLAVLAAPDFFRVFRLQRGVPELAVVADSFHIKPLLRILQSADRYQILGVTRDRVRLFEGNRDVLDEVELAPGVPRTLTEALGEEVTDARLTVSSYGGAQGPAMRHGHGGRKDQVEHDAERFFRAVDRETKAKHSSRAKLPLILAALPENQSVFRRVSHNPYLAEQGIDADPEGLSLNDLRDAAWQLVQPHYLERLGAIVEEYQESRGQGLGTEEAGDAAAAAIAGRVAKLLVDADCELPGRIDATTGEVEFDDLEKADVDDVLDDLATLVARQGGEVVVVPRDRMPTKTGLAAVFRY